MKKKVLVFGTFDGLHEGHLDFFRQAREYGDYLVAVIARDSTVQRTKKKLPQKNEQERLKDVQNCGLVDETRLGNEGKPPHEIIKEINPDVICLGYDQTHFTENLEQKIKEMGLAITIHRLKPYKPEEFHSSIINKQ